MITNKGDGPAGSDDDKLPQNLVNAMQALFGKHPGYRTTHAKGLLVEGVFRPTEQAKALSTASHFHIPTPVIARFSVGGGLPHVADVDDGATPKGVAIRFQVDQDTYTDLVAHSFNGFAVKTGEDFLTFLRLFRAFGAAQAALQGKLVSQETTTTTTTTTTEGCDTAGEEEDEKQEAFDKAQAAFGEFLAAHPSAFEFVNAPKPNPRTYGTLTYFQPNTHVLTNSQGQRTNVRYRLDPAAGEHLYANATPEDKECLERLGPNYLEDDLRQRFPGAPILFTVQAHVADAEDVLDDATIPYKSTNFVPVGTLEIDRVADDNAARQQHISFSPAPERGGVAGVASSGDPLIQARKGVYRISSNQRRHEQ